MFDQMMNAPTPTNSVKSRTVQTLVSHVCVNAMKWAAAGTVVSRSNGKRQGKAVGCNVIQHTTTSCMDMNV